MIRYYTEIASDEMGRYLQIITKFVVCKVFMVVPDLVYHTYSGFLTSTFEDYRLFYGATMCC